MIRKRNEPVVIKKYGNRRLYDTEQSRYVTLQELEGKIRGGTDVRVVDAKTGDDLTQTTLVQIIFEGRGAARMLPVPLLMQLIRLGDEALAEFGGRWMSAALDIYMRARQSAQRMAPYNPFAAMPFDLSSALARMLMGQAAGSSGWGGQAGGWGQDAPQQGWGGQPPQEWGGQAPQGWGEQAPPDEAEAAPGQAPSEVDELRRELEELKASLAGGKAQAAGRKGAAEAKKPRRTTSKSRTGTRRAPARKSRKTED